MRAVLLVLALAACTPDIASGSYLCGPNAKCPDGQACNGDDNVCVVAGAAAPFSCVPDKATEPDDTSGQGYVVPNLSCVSVPFINANCMLQGDAEDWVRFVAPSGCATGVKAEARVTFPVAYERLGMELWNLDAMTKVADDVACAAGGQSGEEIRCLSMPLTDGVTYGIKVHPAGDGNCAGQCAYNRYTLRIQLASP